MIKTYKHPYGSTPTIPCDCCNQNMTEKEFNEQLTCGCSTCRPFVVCKACHNDFNKEE